ncbi:hypothetical protein TGPRC2_240920 [Toxoplasma gondii TgCatPRC2]|uniref:Uncharacterized protein n=3 Tax=Toxoplasma gondii TaxID=5811 RepID=B6KFI0_TOXGV|nr:hypothetical protein TGME49_240920 [Toxoplasma gondii ME49]EPT30660.1 hypothetical protein TGME49_240920 [Toxoplasma gondii ME49]ESS31482.1 hypothetical protein TGVEG_240920 [Toxoplasma gondii VEG]KYK66030.1 hypothetical protein TGPRC2_240920 [Toxoplasma gondii TgCatPRC2]CEL73435.1 TPA: hypothetical protein BN1205_090350 [Toxoplasma gondii VEG]|eukprot:XP_002366711.1 hypothetical protein TGME49_240920 [Toxoplasma gondii ME49]
MAEKRRRLRAEEGRKDEERERRGGEEAQSSTRVERSDENKRKEESADDEIRKSCVAKDGNKGFGRKPFSQACDLQRSTVGPETCFARFRHGGRNSREPGDTRETRDDEKELEIAKQWASSAVAACGDVAGGGSDLSARGARQETEQRREEGRRRGPWKQEAEKRPTEREAKRGEAEKRSRNPSRHGGR